MYGSQSSLVNQGSKFGSYNLFLGMENWLRIFNSSNSSQDVEVTVRHPGGTTNGRVIQMPSRSGTDLDLHNTAGFGTAANTYGQLEVSGEVLVELLRLKRTAAGSSAIDFAAPTAVR